MSVLFLREEMKKDIDVKSLEQKQLVKLLRSHGCKEMNDKVIEEDIANGFPLNDDGTIDIFDYVTWIVGDKAQRVDLPVPDDYTFDLTSVNPTELVGFLNAYNHIGYEIKRGRVTLVFQMYKFRIADQKNERNLNFFKYAALIASPSKRKKPTNAKKATDYEAHKEEMNRRQQAQSASGRDIGSLPEIVNPQRKADCEFDFKLFCESYFPQSFILAWSDDHIKCIEKIEGAVLAGGLFALALPRGSGKTTISECGAIWAALYGHREFIVIIGATETAAGEILSSVKIELETNELLAEDFPEVCYPIEALAGIANRCAGQLYMGQRTRITWTANELVLPTIENSRASGTIVKVAGVTGRIRGMRYKQADGKSVRPSLVIIDDPQTRESAGSIEQNRKRISILAGDILGLAGPGQKISGIMPCTIIRPGDMADQILDRQKHPEWNGEKAKMIYSMPKNAKLWEEYAEIRAEAYRTDGNFKSATEFYIKNREAMDDGAKVGWEQRFNHDEVSALQHAMNLKLQDESAFAAEYQNEPLMDNIGDESTLTNDDIVQKLSKIKKKIVPLECTKIVMFVDVQKALLFYVIAAFADDFTSSVIDYGTYPEQQHSRFTLLDANPTIQTMFHRAGMEAQLYKALENLFKDKMSVEWENEAGTMFKISRAMVDANWGQSTDVVYQFCRQSDYSNIIMPSHGRYVGASSKPMTEYRKTPGAKIGFNWMIPSVAGKRAIRHVLYDTNYWKSFVHARLSVDIGDKGCLTLYGKNPLVHEQFAEHLTAEYRVRTSGRGRTVDEWKIRPERNDNHWFDCLVGCAVCASMLGSTLPEHEKPTTPRETVRLSDRRVTTKVDNIDGSPNTGSTRISQERKTIKLSDIRRNK